MRNCHNKYCKENAYQIEVQDIYQTNQVSKEQKKMNKERKKIK